MMTQYRWRHYGSKVGKDFIEFFNENGLSQVLQLPNSAEMWPIQKCLPALTTTQSVTQRLSLI